LAATLIFGISLTETNNFIANGVAGNLAFFCRELHYIRNIQPKRVGKPMHQGKGEFIGE